MKTNFDVNTNCERLLIIFNSYKYSMLVSFSGMIIVFIVLNMSKKKIKDVSPKQNNNF